MHVALAPIRKPYRIFYAVDSFGRQRADSLIALRITCALIFPDRAGCPVPVFRALTLSQKHCRVFCTGRTVLRRGANAVFPTQRATFALVPNVDSTVLSAVILITDAVPIRISAGVYHTVYAVFTCWSRTRREANLLANPIICR
jgi:hypothetical protein